METGTNPAPLRMKTEDGLFRKALDGKATTTRRKGKTPNQGELHSTIVTSLWLRLIAITGEKLQSGETWTRAE